MKGLVTASTVCITAMLTTISAHAQWITFTNQTAIRLPTGAGENDPALTTADPEQKCYAWGDVDNDGDLDVVVARKRPLMCQGGRRNLLLMNEGGVLIDRADVYATASIGVTPEQGVSQGFLDATNDAHITLVDLNNDGWLDIITAVTMSDTQPRFIGHPRVYMNLGEVDGVWQGFRYEYDRIPQLISKRGVACNPRFWSVSAGDVTGDGFADLYYTDHDTPESSYCGLSSEPANRDMDNRLLVNQGATKPGFFLDESVARMGALIPGSNENLLYSHTGTRGLIGDMNGDGIKDVVRASFPIPSNISVLTNPSDSIGYWSTVNYKPIYFLAGEDFAGSDLNNDGRLDLVICDDATDRYCLNVGNDSNNAPNVTITSLGQDAEFSGRAIITDLDNDGWNDAIIADQHCMTNFVTSRRTRIYRNRTPDFTPLLQEQNSPAPVLPFADAKAVYMAAVFDIDGDGWKDIILGRGNPSGGHSFGSTEVWMNNGKPGLEFTYPNGLPTMLAEAAPTTLQVQITGTHGGQVAPGTPALHVSINGGAFTQSRLADIGGGLYQATIPATPCSSSARFWFSAQVTDGATIIDPSSTIYGGTSPTSHYSAVRADNLKVVLLENFERGAVGWTVENEPSLADGAWEIAAPNGTWNEGIRVAPSSDAMPSGTHAFITGHGAAGDPLDANDVDGGPTHLISPPLNVAGSNAIISFARWFYSSTAGDSLAVSISNDDGQSWTPVKSIHANPVVNWNGPAEFEQTQWIVESFAVRDYITPAALVRVRFTAHDVSPAGVVEAGIDDFIVTRTACGELCAADVTGDLQVDVQDLLAVVIAWGACTPGSCAADVNADGVVNVSDLLAVINAWGPCP